MDTVKIAILGAGLIGRTHIDVAQASEQVTLVGVADPSPAGAALCAALGVPHYADYQTLLAQQRPDGVIIATPNATHASLATALLEAGCHVLIEKPLADDVAQAQRICETAARTGKAALVGHHRRHNAIMRRAKTMIAAGELGRPVLAHATTTWYKRDSYFDVAWRRQPGGGPVLINMVHDIDLMLYLFGPVVTVQACSANASRGFAVEDTAAALLGFANGALGTVTVSDAAVSPWAWDLAAQEQPRFAPRDVCAHFYSGSHGSLSLPAADLWRYPDEPRDWERGLEQVRLSLHQHCPYRAQLDNFVAVMQGLAEPVCSAADALATMQVTHAVLDSAAQNGARITLSSL